MPYTRGTETAEATPPPVLGGRGAARLVARDLSQVHTVDFLETYAPTPAASSLKLLVAIAVKNDWELRQLDVKQAFIQIDLDFNVFMKLPNGCGDKSGKVVKLKKSVYGLK